MALATPALVCTPPRLLRCTFRPHQRVSPARRIAIGFPQREPGSNSALQRQDRRSHLKNCRDVPASLETQLPRRLDEQNRFLRCPASLGLEEGSAAKFPARVEANPRVGCVVD